MQVGKSERAAAQELDVTAGWLSQVLNDKVDASMELYRDFVKYSKGALTLKELQAFRKPSPHRRRKLVDLKPLRRSKKTRAAIAAESPENGKGTVH